MHLNIHPQLIKMSFFQLLHFFDYKLTKTNIEKLYCIFNNKIDERLILYKRKETEELTIINKNGSILNNSEFLNNYSLLLNMTTNEFIETINKSLTNNNYNPKNNPHLIPTTPAKILTLELNPITVHIKIHKIEPIVKGLLKISINKKHYQAIKSNQNVLYFFNNHVNLLYFNKPFYKLLFTNENKELIFLQSFNDISYFKKTYKSKYNGILIANLTETQTINKILSKYEKYHILINQTSNDHSGLNIYYITIINTFHNIINHILQDFNFIIHTENNIIKIYYPSIKKEIMNSLFLTLSKKKKTTKLSILNTNLNLQNKEIEYIDNYKYENIINFNVKNKYIQFNLNINNILILFETIITTYNLNEIKIITYNYNNSNYQIN